MATDTAPACAFSPTLDSEPSQCPAEATVLQAVPLPLKQPLSQVTAVETDSDSDNSSSSSPSTTSTSSWSSRATTPHSLDLSASHLVTSPYPDFENQTRLTDLSAPHRLFAFALTHLTEIRPDYATAPYLESFNWSGVFSLLRDLCAQTSVPWQTQEFYVVIFRSRLKRSADRERLGELDQRSHAEACASGGLLKYWYGECDAEMRNLATCIWRARADAVKGGAGPWHAKAMGAAVEMYEHIDFFRHQLVVGEGAETWELL